MSPIIRQVGFSFFLKVAGGGIGFVTTLVLGRSLGAAGSGLFFLSLSLLVVLATLSRLGFDQWVTKLVAHARDNEDWDAINGLYRLVIRRVFLWSVIASVFAIVMGPYTASNVFNNDDLTPVLFWTGFAIPAFAITWIHAHFFQGMGQIGWFLFFQNLGVNSVFLLLFGALHLFAPSNSVSAESIGMLYCVSSWACLLLARVTWSQQNKWSQWSGGTECPIKWLQEIAPLFVIVVLNQLILWTPQSVLGIYRTEDQVGIYNAAFRVANLVTLVLVGVNSAVFPRFATLHAKGEWEKLKRLTQSSSKLMVLACLPFLLGLFIFPEQILGLFGDEFTSGATALRIVALGQLVNVGTGSVGGLLNMTGNQRIAMVCTIASFVVLAFGCMLLIPKFGAEGAAVSQAAAIGTMMILFTVVCYRRLGFSPLSLRAWFSWK